MQLSPKKQHLMKQERMASNEHEAARHYAEHLIHQDFMEQTYSVIFRAVPSTTYRGCPPFFFLSGGVMQLQ